MAVTSIAIAVPEGMGRRAAIEWAVNHLIKVLDQMDEDEETQRNAPASQFKASQQSGPGRAEEADCWAYQSRLMRRLFTAMPPGGSDAD